MSGCVIRRHFITFIKLTLLAKPLHAVEGTQMLPDNFILGVATLFNITRQRDTSWSLDMQRNYFGNTATPPCIYMCSIYSRISSNPSLADNFT